MPIATSTAAGDPLDEIIAAYLQAVEAGAVPDRRALLDAHPGLADGLRAFFADLDRMDRVAGPLRIEPATDATVDQPDGGSGPNTVRYFGDFELMEKIAEGGMGVVYKARQATLNRVVALKMILRGTLATPRDVARFRAEAESVAALTHPNIVPIYEVGEHDGQQYFAMQFIDGGPLTAAPRGPVRAEVERLKTIADAVSFAHLRGILHRDLKPSNILLDGAGTPFVTDFGLAKRLESGDHSLTETGQVLGTPRYMAPEQAMGRKDLTVAADVYSLGAILYERLAGRPAFNGDNVLTILRQVREAEPPSLAAAVPGIPRDLDTIARKCLAKDPARRYPTADEFAADLKRWLTGEAIQARPVGRLERAGLWSRRNPALATAGAAAVAGLVLSTLTSVGFALQWQRRAHAEGERVKVAIESRAKMQGALVHGLALPLDPEGETKDELSTPELESLWQLARSDDPELGVRFLREGATPPLVFSLRARSEPATIAAVGLDDSKRQRALIALKDALRNRSRDPLERVQIALVAMELVEGPGESSSLFARVIAEALASRTGREDTTRWLFRMDLAEDGHIGGRTGMIFEQKVPTAESSSILHSALNREKNAGIRAVQLRAVAEAAARMGSADAAAATLADALGRETHDGACTELAQGLAAVAARMGPVDAVATLADALSLRNMDSYDRNTLSRELASAVGRIRSTDATRVCAAAAATLAEALGRETDADERRDLAIGLAAVAQRMDPADAAHACAAAAATLAEALGEKIDADARRALATGLAAVAERMDPADAAATLADTISLRNIDNFSRLTLSRALPEVAARMAPADAARVCAAAAATLAEALGRATDADERRYLAAGLAAVAQRMEPADAARACAAVAANLSDAFGRESNGVALSDLAAGLAAVAERMEPADATRACAAAAATLAEALGRATNTDIRRVLAGGLSEVAQRMEPVAAVAILVEVLAFRNVDTNARRILTLTMAEMVPQMDPPYVTTLIDAINRDSGAETCFALAKAVAGIAARMEATAAARSVDAATAKLLNLLDRAGADDDCLPLARGLAALGAKSEPGVASRFCTTAIHSLLRREPVSVESIAQLMTYADRAYSHAVALDLASRVCATRDCPSHAEALDLLLRDTGPRERTRRWENFVEACLSGDELVVPWAESEPYPCLLTTQELVDLLKMPTCFGDARTVVLGHLSNRYGRTFTNHWQFVLYARENGLSLDFTTPAQRPRHSIEVDSEEYGIF